jgi:hypothetical protein
MTAPNRLEFLLLPSSHGFAFALLSLISLISMRISQNRRSYSIAIKIVATTFCQKGHQFSFRKARESSERRSKGSYEALSERKECTFC